MGGTLLERFGAIGFFVMGEGEVTLTELANDNDVSRIDELVWREGCSHPVARETDDYTFENQYTVYE